MKIKNIFEQVNLGGLHLKNRIVRSSTVEFLTNEDFTLTPELLKIYEDLADGEIGLIITAAIAPTNMDYRDVRTMRINNDSFIPELKKITDIVHNKDGKIMAQIGVIGSTTLTPKNDYDKQGPSEVKDIVTGLLNKAMTLEDINAIQIDCANASLRLKEAGFDGIQLQCAHGYLFNQFLSPYYNKRTDQYGGNFLNRARFILETVTRIKVKVGNDFPLFIKMNCSDFFEENGFDFECCKETVKIFQGSGIDAIELSGGAAGGKKRTIQNKIHSYESEGYFSFYAVELGKIASIPIISVGGYRSLEKIEDVLQNKNIEAISLSRPFISEPHLVKRWSLGDTNKSRCLSCTKCFNLNGIKCILNN